MKGVWSEEEKERLQDAVKQSNQNNRVDWFRVSELHGTRSPNQCKTEFRTVLKMAPQVNHIWSDFEAFELQMLVYYYGQKWEFIRKHYFPNYIAS